MKITKSENRILFCFYLLRMKFNKLAAIILIVFVISPFINIIHASTYNNNELLDKFSDPKIDHFEKKRILDGIDNDTLLIKIAMKYENCDYNDYESYFKYHSLLKIKDINLIYDKADSIEMDLFLFRKFMLNANDTVFKRVLNCKPRHSNPKQMRGMVDKYIFRNAKDIFYLCSGGPYRTHELSNIFFNSNEPNKEIGYSKIVRSLEDMKKRKSAIKRLINYSFVNYYDLIIINNFNNILEYLTNSNDRLLDFSLIMNDTLDYNLLDFSDSELISKLKNDTTNQEIKFKILNKLKSELITINLYNSLPVKLKPYAILKINNEELLYEIIISSKNKEIQFLAGSRIYDQKVLNKLINYVKNNNSKRLKELIYGCIAKFKDDNMVSDLFEKGYSYIIQSHYIKDNNIIYNLLKSISVNKKKIPFGDLLFYLNDQNIIRKIIFEDFNENIKYSVLPFIESESLFSDILKSDLNINFKLACINHPFMTNDSLLSQIAVSSNIGLELSGLISEKLNTKIVKSVDYDNYKKLIRKLGITPKTSYFDSLYFELISNSKIIEKPKIINKLTNDKDMSKIYEYFKQLKSEYKKNKSNYNSGRINDILSGLIKKIKNNKILYKMFKSENWEYLAREIAESKLFIDQQLIYNLLKERLDGANTLYYKNFDYSTEMILSKKLIDVSLLQKLCRLPNNVILLKNILESDDYKYYMKNSEEAKNYFYYSFKYCNDLSIKRKIIYKFRLDITFLNRLVEIDNKNNRTTKLLEKQLIIEPKINEAKELLSNGKNIKEYLECFKSDQESLKWLYENSNRSSRQDNIKFYKKFAITNINDSEYLYKNLNRLKFNSALWKLLVSRLSYDEIFKILSSSQFNMDYKEKAIENVTDQVILKKIIDNDKSKLTINAALINITDPEFLTEYYINNDCKGYSYNKLILEKLPDEYINVISKRLTSQELSKKVLYFIDDQKLLEEYSYRYKDFEFAKRISDIEKRRKLFWEIEDESFKTWMISYCMRRNEKANNRLFLLKILNISNFDKVKTKVLDQIIHYYEENDIEYLVKLFYMGNNKDFRRRMISILSHIAEFEFLSKEINYSAIQKIKDFLSNLITDTSIKKEHVKLAQRGLNSIRTRIILQMKEPDEFLKALLEEKEPYQINTIFRQIKKKLYNTHYDKKTKTIGKGFQKKLEDYIKFYIKNGKMFDSIIIRVLSEFTKDEEILKTLYEHSENYKTRIQVIEK